MGLKHCCGPLLRRALCAYEAALPRYEVVRELVGSARWRVDAADVGNVPFLAALLRSARAAQMVGAPETAANLFGALLSLDAATDPCCVLLRLDGDFLAAQRFDDALSLFDTPLPIGPGCQVPGSAAGGIDLFEDAATVVLDGGTAATTRMLPGVCLSRGLCLFRLGRRQEAVEAVAEALASFPHLLVCMLDACGIDAEKDRSTEYDFRELLWHDQFRKKTHETWQKRAYQMHALPRALDCCCLRTRQHWAAQDAMRLLHDGAAALVKRLGYSYILLLNSDRPGVVDEVALSAADANWSLSPLVKYAGAPIAEFKDEYNFLGPEAAEGFDEAQLTSEAAKAASTAPVMVFQRGHQRAAPAQRGGGGGEDDALNDLLQQIPEELRPQVIAQAQSGLPLQEIQAALFSLFD